jgi:PPK2 family polyphosphate:nucleotide phosphotransferase
MAGGRAGQKSPEKWVGGFVRHFQVDPGAKVKLARDFDTASKAGIDSKADGVELLTEMIELLAEYQMRLAAQDTWGLLVVLQAIDAGGKDGTIRHVMSGVNPQGVSVRSFKVPSDEELDHDYLWRYAEYLPQRGQIAIFNRSHYEEVLVVRVHQELIARQKLPPQALGPGIWRRRYREINNWERHLVDNGIRIVKLFLNLSKEEQRRRFIQRIDDPDRNWKFSAADLEERKLWDEYQHAFSEMLSNTSTKWAPWHVIPADRKWYARVASAGAIANALIEIDPKYPEVSDEVRAQFAELRAQLEAEGPADTPDEHDDD